MDYRLLETSDIPQLIEIWNESIDEYPITSKDLLYVLFCDENYNRQGCWVAAEREKIVGFCLGIKRRYPYLEKGLQENQGWILAIAVDRLYRNQGIGTKLLKKVEDFLRCDQIILAAYSPHYFFPGVVSTNKEAISFFIKAGYRKQDTVYSMELDLLQYQKPSYIMSEKEKKEQAGYQFAFLTWKDGKELLEFLKCNFSVGWRKLAIETIKSENAEKQIILCRNNNRIVGYIQRGVLQKKERFGPFGIEERERGNGLGAILLHEMWVSMKQVGCKWAWFHSTDENGRRFYERHGMRVKRTLFHYVKLI